MKNKQIYLIGTQAAVENAAGILYSINEYEVIGCAAYPVELSVFEIEGLLSFDFEEVAKLQFDYAVIVGPFVQEVRSKLVLLGVSSGKIRIFDSDFLRKKRVANTSSLTRASIEAANCVYLRKPIAEFPGIDAEEACSLRYLNAGLPEEAVRHLRDCGRRRGSSYEAVRYWNKLIIDWRESRLKGRELEKGCHGIVGLWDLRFVPHSLGEYLYFLAVLQCVSEDLGLDKVEIWCLVPGEDQIRFDQKDLDEPIRSTRVRQFKELTAFLRSSPDSFLFFEDTDTFDEAVVLAMRDRVVVPRWESSSGGMFASYMHNYRFLNQAYAKSGRAPHLKPCVSYMSEALERIDTIKRKSGKTRVVATHLRYSKLDAERNVEIDEWIELFRHAALVHQDLLFLILGEGELEQTLENEDVLGNCCFAKDYAEGAMEGFVLIHAADGFIGGPSGPAIVPLLSPNPYLFYKYKLVNELPYLELPAPFPWATSGQVIHWLEHDTQSLVEAFDNWIECVR